MITLKVIRDNGTEYTVENVLDFAYWDTEHCESCINEELTEEQKEKVFKEVSNALSDMSYFADSEEFQQVVEEVVEEIKGGEKLGDK